MTSPVGALRWTQCLTASRHRKDEIDHGFIAGFPMLDGIGADAKEISRQLWALLGPLVSAESGVHTLFANCPCHDGLEARRRVAEPINDDKILIMKELLPPRSPTRGRQRASRTCRLPLERGTRT